MNTHGEPGAVASAIHDAGAATSRMFSGEEEIARTMRRPGRR
jgi:hypothetical protein